MLAPSDLAMFSDTLQSELDEIFVSVDMPFDKVDRATALCI
jgi:hypothetical protein